MHSLYISKAKAAKHLANKEKAMAEKARQEDNLSQSKELLEISDELATVKISFISSTCKILWSLLIINIIIFTTIGQFSFSDSFDIIINLYF